MLNMEDFAEAIVGMPGEGLNVEQRKLLTIGVELAAKPKLLLFLDEPTRYVLKLLSIHLLVLTIATAVSILNRPGLFAHFCESWLTLAKRFFARFISLVPFFSKNSIASCSLQKAARLFTLVPSAQTQKL